MQELKSLAKVVVEALGDSLPTKNLGEVKFFLGCEFIVSGVNE